jgi:hypothetical protein
LTAEQQEIVELLANDKLEILLFDYQAKEAYNRMSVWIEVYQDGALVDRPAGLETGNSQSYQHKGRLAIAISQNPDFQWVITIDEEGSRSTHRPADAQGTAVDPTLNRSHGPLNGGAMIESGKEIVLYSSAFSSGGALRTIDALTLEHSPGMLKEYEFVHLIKCKFE